MEHLKVVLGTQHLGEKNHLKVSFVWHHLLVNFYFLYKLLFGFCATIPEITTHFQIISETALLQTVLILIAPDDAASKGNKKSSSKPSWP